MNVSGSREFQYQEQGPQPQSQFRNQDVEVSPELGNYLEYCKWLKESSPGG